MTRYMTAGAAALASIDAVLEAMHTDLQRKRVNPMVAAITAGSVASTNTGITAIAHCVTSNATATLTPRSN